MRHSNLPPIRWLRRTRDIAARRYPWVRHVGWAEAVLLVCALVVVVLISWFIELADEVQEGDTTRFDEWAVRAFRRADDLAMPIGPVWVREIGLDLTALGGHPTIVLVILAVGAFLALQRKWRTLILILAASIGAMIISDTAKAYFERPRPSIVPHWREVATLSFPSGHATISAAVYLTLGAILAQVVRGRWTRAYCLVLPMVVVVLIGLSRVYLGVHYPTDVLAGWGLGLTWALICWAVANYLQQRGLLERRRSRPA